MKASLLVAWAILLAACGSEREVEVKVLERQGLVEGRFGGAWKALEPGDQLRTGDGLRTGPGASARLGFKSGAVVRVDAETQLYLSKDREGRPKLALELGRVQVETDVSSLSLEIGDVVSVAEPHSKAKLERESNGRGRIEVELGRVTVVDGDEKKGLSAGLKLEIGEVLVQKQHVQRADAGLGTGGVLAPDPEGHFDEDDEAMFRAVLKRKSARVRVPGSTTWETLRPGTHRLGVGVDVEIPAKGVMELHRRGDAAHVLGPAALRTGERRGVLLDLQRGEGVVVATGRDVSIALPGGRLVASAHEGEGSRARVQVQRKNVRVHARRGRLLLATADGQERQLQLGDEASMEGGRIVLRPTFEPVADFDAVSSEVIHDPEPPTAVGFDTSQCGELGVVELSRKRTFGGLTTLVRGQGRAIARVGTGAVYARVRCLVDGRLEKARRAPIRLKVVADRSQRKLVDNGVTNEIHADGRKYRVLYQNRFPSIRVRWLKAPKSDSYDLIVQGKTRREVRSRKADVTLQSGTLAEGRYEFWFQAGAAKGRTGTLLVKFDNKAPTFYMSRPAPDEPWVSETLVSGAVVAGWKAFAGQEPLALDEEGRFRKRLSLPRGLRAISVVLRSPKGVRHRVLRRAN